MSASMTEDRLEEDEEYLEDQETMAAVSTAPLHIDARDHVPLLLRTLCDRGAKVQPDNLIITKVKDDYLTITYREHQIRSLRLGSALARWGVRIGDRVGTLLWNNAWHLQAYHAISCMGAVLHTVNARLGSKDMGYIVWHSGDRVIIVDSDLFDHLASLRQKILNRLELFVAVGLDGVPGQWTRPHNIPETKVKDYEDFLNSGTVKFLWPEINEISPHSLCYTSGTTGVPKGVIYSQRSTFLHTVVNMVAADQYAIDGTMIVNPFVPMFHVLSWGFPFATLMLGTRTVFTGRFSTGSDLLDTLLKWRVEMSTGVPTVWQSFQAEVMKRGVGKVRSGLNLRTLITGGSAPSMDMQEWYYQNLGVEIMQGWGMTETNPSGTIAKRIGKYSDLRKSLKEQFTNITKAGIPAPGVDVRIADPNNYDKEKPHGEPGEMLVRGPWIITRYFQHDAPEKFHRGWLVTGDIAKIDAEGAVILMDRSKDAVKSGGEWISSVDLENHICAMSEISSAAVIGAPHPKWDERPVAIVTLNNDVEYPSNKDSFMERVNKHCSQNFAKFQWPDDVVIWEELPLNSTGKIDKKAIRDKLQKDGYILPSLRAPDSKL
jgi:fatty-acyl-CoA synthase